LIGKPDIEHATAFRARGRCWGRRGGNGYGRPIFFMGGGSYGNPGIHAGEQMRLP
jgi:hypothetical protein